MSVEFGRSCYSSEWRLFRDDPERITRGRYYFSPTGARAYPGIHNLGSRDWHDRNWITEQALGEDLSAEHEWSAGQLPTDVPADRFLGSLPCIENGSTSDDVIDVDDLVNGFPVACMPTPDDLAQFDKLTSYARCQTQKFYAAAIAFLYDEDEDKLVELFQEWIGAGANVTFHPRVNVFPAVCTVVSSRWSIVMVEGTTNFQQLALQAFESIVGPTNIGIYGTLPLWYTTATYVNALLTGDGADAEKPIFMAGHSYGAATLHNLMARYRAANPNRVIRYLTYGAPKPGDDRMIKYISLCQGFDMCNDGDLVTLLPPDVRLLTPAAFIIGAPSLALYTLWRRPPRQMLQFADGELVPREPTLLDTSVLVFMIEQVIDLNPLAAITAHGICKYLERITLRCPAVGWPLVQTVVDTIQECSCFDELGLTCETAIDLPIGVPFDIDPEPGQSYWFNLLIPGIDSYRFMMERSVPLNGTGVCITQCPPGHDTYFQFLSTDDCVGFFVASDFALKMRVEGTAPFTIKWEAGICP